MGYTFALHAHRLGFNVLAGCLQPDGEGSEQLLQLYSQRLQVLGLNITNETSVRAAVKAVEDMLVQEPELGMRSQLGSIEEMRHLIRGNAPPYIHSLTIM